MKQFTLDEIHKQILMELFFAFVFTAAAIPLAEMRCIPEICNNHFNRDFIKAEEMLSHARDNLCEYQPLYECRGGTIIRSMLLEQVREDKKEGENVIINGLKDNVCRTLKEWKLVTYRHSWI